MRKQPSYSMGAIPSKFQLEFIFHKLELILSNPSAKISLILRLGSQKQEVPIRFKAMKEINLQEVTIPIQTVFYENKSGLYQEKIAQIDICLTNSKLTNSIGIIKMDLALLANQATTFEKLEYLQMQRSVEYQGKVLFTIKGNLIEKGTNCFDDLNKREYSEIGLDKRSLTPTPKSSARNPLMKASKDIIAQRKITSLMRNKSKSPIRQKEEVKLGESPENEQITLEKMLKTLKMEKEKTENSLKIKNEHLNASKNNLHELELMLQALERENQEINQENKKVILELSKNKELIEKFHKPSQEKTLQEREKTINENNQFVKINDNKNTEENLQELEGKIAEVEKSNEKILLEKLELQIVLQMLKKKKDEYLRILQNLKTNLQQKDQEIDVLDKMYNDLQSEFSKISTKEVTRSHIVPTNDQDECEKKCKNLIEKNATKQKDLDKINENISLIKPKWCEREKELNNLQEKFNEIVSSISKYQEKIDSLNVDKKNIEANILEVSHILKDIEESGKDAEERFYKAKHDISEIHNVLMEKGQVDLIEELEQIKKKHDKI